MLNLEKIERYLFLKHIFDVVLAIILFILLLPVFLFISILIVFDLYCNPLYLQKRIGRYGKVFIICKFRTIHPKQNTISHIGKFLRKYKFDEFPQLINIIKGDMSFVGPRPDLPGFYDQLQSPENKLLILRPGITSYASIKYRNEEQILNSVPFPEKYNLEVIFPDKVKMNLSYLEKISFKEDIQIIYKTIMTFLN